MGGKCNFPKDYRTNMIGLPTIPLEGAKGIEINLIERYFYIYIYTHTHHLFPYLKWLLGNTIPPKIVNNTYSFNELRWTTDFIPN